MSIAVVAIHTRLGGAWETTPLYPWLRLAVPLFFMISAYLFFKKYNIANETGKWRRLERFVVRNGQLYLFWFAILLIPTLFVRRGWFEPGILQGLGHFMLGFLFGSTFPASWYITASVTAVVMIALTSRRLPAGLVLLVAVACYVFACLACNYGNVTLWGNRTVTETLGDLPPLGNPYNNFFVALLWVLLGKIAAEHELCLSRLYTKRKTALVVSLLIGLALLYAEQLLIRAYGTAFTNDCYLSLPLPVFVSFVFIMNLKARSEYSMAMRAASTITYCFHATFAVFIVKGADLAGLRDYGIVEFAVVLLASWAVSWLILHLEKRPRFSILRYAH